MSYSRFCSDRKQNETSLVRNRFNNLRSSRIFEEFYGKLRQSSPHVKPAESESESPNSSCLGRKRRWERIPLGIYILREPFTASQTQPEDRGKKIPPQNGHRQVLDVRKNEGKEKTIANKMMKYAVLIFALVVMGESQRPPYAGSPNRYPQVLTRFKDQTSTTAPPSTAAAGVGNRVGEESANSVAPQASVGGGVATAAAAAPVADVSTTQTAPTVPTTPRDLPVHALGDADLVDRIMSWPEDLRPFWFTNRQQIDAHLHPVGQQTVPSPEVGKRSFFAG